MSKLKDKIKNLFKNDNQVIEIRQTPSIVTIVGIFAILSVLVMNLKTSGGEGVVFKNLSAKYESIENGFNGVLLNKDLTKKESANIKTDANHHNVFVVSYNGTMMATEVKFLTKKIDAILLKANPNDEVIIKMTSPGGVVNGYGLVASQIQRLKSAGLKITTAVDTMAASGGYLAAVVSDKIVAAPFAYVGSIGVVANVMIVEDLLKKIGVESKVYTSGDSKRTVVPTKMPTKEEEAKFKHELEEIHTQFKNHVLKYRPKVDPKIVFTGQAFLANEALNYGLVDEIGTSDDLLLKEYKKGNRLIEVNYYKPQPLVQKVTNQATAAFVDVIKTELSGNQTIIQ